MKITKYPKSLALLVIVVAAIAYSYSWTDTPHGHLDYRAAVSLHLLSFETKIKPDPTQDFELALPVNMIYALSGMLPKDEVLKTEDVTIPGDGVDVPARVYWPKGTAADTRPPVLLYYHGGGFVVGSVDIFDPLARSLADTTGAIVVSVDYRLAPASPYPAAVNDCYTALEWAAAHAEELGGDATKLIVAGDSAGGNLAAVVALKAKNENGPAIAAQILYYPVADLTGKPYASAKNFMDGYGLSSQSGAAFQKAYFGHVEDARDPYLSPLYAESLQDLPPVLLVTAGFDPLTDGANAYAARMKEAGVAVTTRHYASMIHGFMSIGLFSQQRDALEQTKTFLDNTL